MIDIYKADWSDCPINYFYGKTQVRRDEFVIKTETVFKRIYTYAEPIKPGNYAFGGNLLFTSNGIYPEFANGAIKLHDRQMNLEAS